MSSKSLAFTMQHQKQTNWCWAAVSTSVSLFYNANSGWTQCSVANSSLGQSTCCSSPSSSFCNKPWYLNEALTTTSNLNSYTSGAQVMSTIQAQINAGKPIGCRIQWRPSGGHFVLINGYNVQASTVDIRDPWYGNSNGLSLNTFTNNYKGSGYWNYTYYTQS